MISLDLDNPIAIPWILARDITLEDLLAEIEKVLQSNKHFRLHSGARIVIIRVVVPEGQGHINYALLMPMYEPRRNKVLKNQDDYVSLGLLSLVRRMVTL